MNRKQIITLWIMVILLSLLSIVNGLKEDSLLYGAAIPILLIGGMLFWQLRDPSAMKRDVNTTTRTLLVLLALNLALNAFQTRQNVALETSVGEIVSRTADIDSQNNDLDDELSAVKTEIEEVKDGVSELRFSR